MLTAGEILWQKCSKLASMVVIVGSQRKFCYTGSRQRIVIFVQGGCIQEPEVIEIEAVTGKKRLNCIRYPPSRCTNKRLATSKCILNFCTSTKMCTECTNWNQFATTAIKRQPSLAFLWTLARSDAPPPNDNRKFHICPQMLTKSSIPSPNEPSTGTRPFLNFKRLERQKHKTYKISQTPPRKKTKNNFVFNSKQCL